MGELTLTYMDEPVGAKEGTTPTIDDLQDFCTLKDILRAGNTAPQHATLELDYWRLDGKFSVFPDAPTGPQWGVISRQIADAAGAFSAPITLVLSLDALYSAVAMTLEFDSYGPTWATEVHINWCRADTVIASKDFTPDTWRYVCYNEVHGFDRVEISFSRMSHGYRYLKLQALTYGITRVFESDELFGMDLFQDADLISDQVSINTFSVTIRNKTDIKFLFQRRQSMYLRDGAELIGVYYISTHTKSGSSYHVSTVDQVGLAEMAGEHMGGIYNGVPAATIVADILGRIPWEMDADLQDVLLYGRLPIATRRDNLQQVAFALCAMVRTARRTSIQITKPSNALQGAFAPDSSYENGSIVSNPLITSVSVTAHVFTPNNTVDTLYEGTLNGVEDLIFNDSVHSIQITGGAILASGANYAKISGTGGAVLLTGKKYDHGKRIYTKANPLVTASDAAKPQTYPDMTLVSPYNIEAVLESCYAHNLRLDTIKGKVLTAAEGPGDYVEIQTDDGAKRGHLLSMDYTISAKLAADVVVLADYTEEAQK